LISYSANFLRKSLKSGKSLDAVLLSSELLAEIFLGYDPERIHIRKDVDSGSALKNSEDKWRGLPYNTACPVKNHKKYNIDKLPKILIITSKNFDQDDITLRMGLSRDAINSGNSLSSTTSSNR
jgi:hypothetical protein